MEQVPNIVLAFFFFDSLLTTVVGNWHHIILEEGLVFAQRWTRAIQIDLLRKRCKDQLNLEIVLTTQYTTIKPHPLQYVGVILQDVLQLSK